MAKSRHTPAQRKIEVNQELAELRSAVSDQQDRILELQAALDQSTEALDDKDADLDDLRGTLTLAVEQARRAEAMIADMDSGGRVDDSSYTNTSRLCLDFPMALCGMLGVQKALHTPSFVLAVKELLGDGHPRLRLSPLRLLLAGSVEGVKPPIRTIPPGSAKRVEQILTALDIIETVYHNAQTAQGEPQDAKQTEVHGAGS
jgi:hypothetical protein